MNSRAGILCGVLAPLLWVTGIVLCGTLRPGYSHFAQYISELGERGSSTEFLMRYGAFVPTGLMHLAFAGPSRQDSAAAGWASSPRYFSD
jgi:hypothetical membrane protein